MSLTTRSSRTPILLCDVTQYSQPCCSAFKTFGLFSSGIGVHYAESNIVDVSNQDLAKKLTIGQRLVPQVLVRAADARPENIQELAPSDTRFKLFVFPGDISQPAAKAALAKLAEYVGEAGSFFRKFTPSGAAKDAVFDILTIAYVELLFIELVAYVPVSSTTKKETVNYNDVPQALRAHWSKVWVDDEQLAGGLGGKVYETYGIDSQVGAIVVIRPDGYVSAVAPLDGFQHLDSYFSKFLKPVTAA